MKYRQYIGIFLGAVYGLVLRWLAEPINSPMFQEGPWALNIYSISFLWVLPIVMGIIPILFAYEEVLNNRWKHFVFPMLSVFLFFLFAISSGLEDFLCLLILALPFLLAAGVAGLVAGYFLRKKHRERFYFVLLLPFLFQPLESFFPTHVESFEVHSHIASEANPAKVWTILLEVPEITEEEYSRGFFNYLGVPRPVKSECIQVQGETYRIGHFSGGLKLWESVVHYDSLEVMSFRVHIDRSELRDLPTDKHLLNSEHFHFEDITYRLQPLAGGGTRLTLSCTYSIESNMKGYANFWAERIVKDFEERLLKVLKGKLESGA